MDSDVESTPGRNAIVAMKEISNDIIFKKPVGLPKKRTKQKILDEDTYIEQIGKIIERDFFPDLEKLKAQNEYLEAMEQNDIRKMRELYTKYSGNKPTTQRMPSPATFETPANIHNSQETPALPEDAIHDLTNSSKHDPKLTLDQYLNMHTSQDNESFEELMIEAEEKHRQKYSYLYNEEEKSDQEKKQQLALPGIEQQCALPEKKLDIDTWTYKNKNYIMYVPDGVALTPEELIEMNKKRQEIEHSNTRLTQNPFNEVQSKETITELAKTQAKVLDGKIGVDGKELIQSNTPKINGFSFIRSPSPCPGVLQSPLMTWGEIEGTPFRLDGSDTPLPTSKGPSFKMAEPPRREQIAYALAEKVGEKHREQKRKAMDTARRNFASPSPRPHTSTIERLATMSPAAQKLAASKLRKSIGDSSFRASYSPSPIPRTKTPTTPRRTLTPKLNLGIKRAINDNLTDDLLKIEVPKRNKASDFF